MNKLSWNHGHPTKDGYYLAWNKTLKRREVLRWDSKKQKWFVDNFMIKNVGGWYEIPDNPKD